MNKDIKIVYFNERNERYEKKINQRLIDLAERIQNAIITYMFKNNLTYVQALKDFNELINFKILDDENKGNYVKNIFN